MKSLLGIEILIYLFLCSNLIGQDGIIPEESILNSNEFLIRNNNIEPDNKDSNRDDSLNLNEKLKQTLSKYSPSRLRIESVSPRTVLLFSLPFGAETTFLIGKKYSQQLNDTTEPVYAIGALCWNVPCSNKTLLRLNNIWEIKSNQVQAVHRPLIQWDQNNSTISPYFFNPSLNNSPQGQQNNQNIIQNPPNNSNELIFPNDNDLAKEIIVKIGNGYQKKRGELFAALAFSAIATDYEIRLDDQKFQIKNLIESEKRRCFLHEDLSQLAIGFSVYLPDFQEEWKNAWNEVWTLEKLAKYELLRPIDWGSSEATDKLLGLTYLLQRTEKELSNEKLPNRDNYQKMSNLLRQYLTELQATALSLRNADGLWTSHFFLNDYPTNNQLETLLTTAHFVRWLILFLTVPESTEITDEIKKKNKIQLQELESSISALNSLLESIFSSSDPRSLSQLSPIEAEALCVSLHSMALYLKRTE